MVPTDQPELAYDMIMEFIRTKKISSRDGPLNPTDNND